MFYFRPKYNNKKFELMDHCFHIIQKSLCSIPASDIGLQHLKFGCQDHISTLFSNLMIQSSIHWTTTAIFP